MERRRKKKRKSFFLRRYLGGGWPEKERWAGIKEMATERARGGLIPELLHTVRLNARKRASAARRCIIRQRASSRTAHLSPPDNQRRKKKERSCEKLASFCITYLIGEHHLFVQFSSIPFNTAMKANIACVLLALAVSSGKLYSCPNFSFVTTNCLSMFDFFIIRSTNFLSYVILI